MLASSPRALVTGLFLTAAAGLVHAQTFRGIGFPGTNNDSFATAVSGDGSIVVGAAYYSDGGSDGLGGYVAIRWTPGGGLQRLGLLPEGDSSFAYGVSGDGSVTSGGACGRYCNSAQPFRWLAPAGPLEPLGYMPGSSYSYGYGVSDDGSTIAGYGVQDGTYEVYPTMWREDRGVVRMDRFPQGGTAIAHTASGDGSYLAGRGFDADRKQQAARWSADGAILPLGFLADPGPVTFSVGRGITPDGAVVVGTAHGADGLGGHTYQGFKWTQAGGMQGLGVSGPYGDLPSTAAMDVSASGATIVGEWGGETGFGDNANAAVWKAGMGWCDLATWLLTEHNLEPVADWQLVEALGVSNDGSVIVGWGINRFGWPEGFVATVPPECRADFNGDGSVNALDFLAFLNAWVVGDPRTDFNGDGVANTLDVLAFLNAWAGGC